MSPAVGAALALAGAILYGVSDFLGGEAARVAPPTRVVLRAQTRSLVPVGVWLLAVHNAPSSRALIGGLVVGTATVASMTLLFSALSTAPGYVPAPLCAVVGGVVSAGVGFAVQGHLAPFVVLGALTSLAGVASPITAWLTGSDEHRFGVILNACTAGVATGVALVLLGLIIPTQLPWLMLTERLATISILHMISSKNDDERTKSAWPWAIGTGYVAASALYQAGAAQGGLALASVAVSIYPSITVLLYWRLRGQSVPIGTLIGLLMSGAGLGVMSFASNQGGA